MSECDGTLCEITCFSCFKKICFHRDRNGRLYDVTCFSSCEEKMLPRRPMSHGLCLMEPEKVRMSLNSLDINLPEVMDPEGVVAASWNSMKNVVHCSDACIKSVCENDTDNCDDIISGGKKCLSLFFHIAKVKKQDISLMMNITEKNNIDEIEKILARLEDLYLPWIFVMFGRLLFYRRCRHKEETVEDYLRTLETLADYCEFGGDRDYIIKQHFLKCGEINSSLRRLIQESAPRSLKEIFSSILVRKNAVNADGYTFCRKITNRRHTERLRERYGSKQRHKCKPGSLQKLHNVASCMRKTFVQVKPQKFIPKADLRCSSERKELQSNHNDRSLDCNVLNVLGQQNNNGIVNRFSESSYTKNSLLSSVSCIKILEHAENGNAKEEEMSKNHLNNYEQFAENNDSNIKKSYRDGKERREKILSVNSDNKGMSIQGEGVMQSAKIMKSLIKQSSHTPGDQPTGFTLKEKLPNENENGIHLRKEREDSFTCHTCKLIFPSIQEYRDHVKVHVCMCEICGTRFAYPALLDRHMFRHTGIRYISTKTIPPKNNHKQKNKLFCSTCNSNFQSVVKFKNHTVNYCEICRAENVGSNCSHEKIIICQGSKKRKQHICDLCGTAFFGIYELYKHTKVHSVDHSFRCDYCCNNFLDKSTLNKHLATHKHKKINRGNPSKLMHSSKQLLFCSKASHDCNVCLEKFSKKVYLKNHLRSHSGETPYRCDLCGACFKARWNLSRHYLVHSGAKPHTCFHCSKSFKWQSTLTAHMKSHEKPLESPQNQNLITHSSEQGLPQQAAVDSGTVLPPPLISQISESSDRQSAEPLHVQHSHNTQEQNLGERPQKHEQHQQMQQSLLPLQFPAESLTDVGRIPGHPPAGMWSPYFGGIPSHRPDWVYWTE